MAKTVSADTLLKRLQKIERAQGRLGDITTRIGAQADTLAELLKVAQGFVTEKPAAKPAGRARSASATTAAAPKRSARKRSGPKATATRSTAPRASATAKAAPAPTRRRAPRKVASA